MADLDHFDIGKSLTRLLEDLLLTWTEDEDIKHVREYLDHAEYGEALDNLIAVGLSNGVGFDRDQLERVNGLATAMGMTDAAAMVQSPKAIGYTTPGM